jgi:hypothetical protein
VLKQSSEPYLCLRDKTWQVKLKKDYIPGLADSVDLVVVGGRRDPKVVQTLGLGNLSWTTFYLACMDNKDQGHHSGARPAFRIVGTVICPCVSVGDLKRLNELGRLCQLPFARYRTEMAVYTHLPRPEQPTELFKVPMVVEVIGAGFDRPSNARFFSLRFPRVRKIHEDRSFLDTLSFVEYQRLANESMQTLQEATQTADDFQIAKLDAPCISKTASSSLRSTVRSGSSSEADTTFSAPSQCPGEPGGSLSPPRFCATKRKAIASQSLARRKLQRRTLMSTSSVNESSARCTLATPTTSGLARMESPAPHHNKHFSPGMLIHESLLTAFLDPDRELLQALQRSPVNVTFDVERFWRDTGNLESFATNVIAERTRALFDVVLVDWSQGNSLHEEARSALSEFEVGLRSTATCMSRRILFLHWKALELLKSDAPASLASFQEHIGACLLYDKGLVKLFACGKTNWARFLTECLDASG